MSREVKTFQNGEIAAALILERVITIQFLIWTILTFIALFAGGMSVVIDRHRKTLAI